MQQIRVPFFGEPTRLPSLVVSKPESIGMHFLAHADLLNRLQARPKIAQALCVSFRLIALGRLAHNRDVTHTALIAVRPAHRSRPDALYPRPFVDERLRNH